MKKIFFFIFICSLARADEFRPKILNDVGIDQHLGDTIPSDLVFKDESGRDVKLGDYLGKRPIILSLVYYSCPMLCTTQLNELAAVMNVMTTSAGEQFDVLTISFDPREMPPLAAAKKEQYLHEYRRPHAAEGWHFLTGDEASIKTLTQSVGFRFAWDEKYQQFAHPSGLIILSPSGTISRYFFGINYAPKDLRLSLVEASEGKTGTLADTALLFCFHYDPSTGQYTLAVLNLMRGGAALTLGVLGFFWLRSFRRHRLAIPA